jgi:hypothetical protein
LSQVDDEALAAFGRSLTAQMEGVQEWMRQAFHLLARAVARAADDTGKMLAAAFSYTWDDRLHYHAPDAPRRVLRRCRACHPEGNPLPLAVDGRGYRRRQSARRRRGRGQ